MKAPVGAQTIFSFLLANYRRYLMAIVFVLSGAFAGLDLNYVGLTDDTNTLLHGSFHLLNNGDLYEHWMEVSPPLVMLLFAVPALAIRAWHLSPAFALHGFVVVLCCVSLLMTMYALHRQGVDKDTRRTWIAAAAFTLFIAPQFFEVYTDREHFLFIFALPWAIQMLLRLSPLPYTAAFAALGFCVKPYNVIIYAFFILFAGPREWTFKQKIFSPSSFIMMFIGLAYIALIYFCFPGYIRTVVPIAMLTYNYIQETAYDKNVNILSLVLPAIAAIAFFIQDIRRKMLWAGVLFAFYCVYMINGGWVYTRYLLLAPLTLVLFEVLGMPPPETWRWYGGVRICAALSVMCWITYGSAQSLFMNIDYTSRTGYAANHNHMSQELYNYLKQSAGENFVLLSTTVWGTNVEGLDSAPHSLLDYDYLWPLPWLQKNNNAKKADMVRQSLTEAFKSALKEKPIVIVDDSTYNRGLPKNSDVLALMSEDEAVRALLKPYKPINSIDRCSQTIKNSCRFTVWKAM